MSVNLEGSAYGRQAAVHDPEMTEVGPEKPCGELLRRYWQPITFALELDDVSKKIRILDKELIVFRDKSGRIGLLEPRRCHRDTSLHYGRIEEKGIRCRYHG